MSVFTPIRNVAPIVQLTSPQMALILALESVLQKAGLWLVCEVCARERNTYKHLVTANSEKDTTWRIDCPCTQRRFARTALQHSMIPSGDLLTLAETLLAGTSLAIRCPVKMTRCLTTPLQVTATPEGVTARCQCWQIEVGAGVYRFRKSRPAA